MHHLVRADTARETGRVEVAHDLWFREKIQEVHGITPDMLQGPMPASLRFDHKAG